jgi:hypothetical protein
MVCPMYVRCGCRPELVLIPPITGWVVVFFLFWGLCFSHLCLCFELGEKGFGCTGLCFWMIGFFGFTTTTTSSSSA